MNLKQLSHMLSLSQTTVSRALNGYPEVSEETRRRVVDAAKRHGYRPNPSARRLATGKAGMIGYVMPTGDSVDIDPHFVEFLSGLGDYARAHELDLVLSPTAVDEEETTYRRIVANKQVDAIYVSSPRPADRRIVLLNQLGIPYIVHGRSEGLDFDYPYLDIDNEGGVPRCRAAAGAARASPHRADQRRDRQDLRDPPRARRAAGAGRERTGARARTCVLGRDDRGERLSRRARPARAAGAADGRSLCSSMIMALGIARATRELGLAIPGDVSLVAHDDVFHYLKPESFPVPLTTTRSSIRAAGQRIAERLAARMSGLETGPRGELWPVDLVVRGSIAGAPV